MPQANADVVRRLYEAGDAGGLDRGLELLDPEIEFDLTGVFPDQGIGRGRDAFREALSAYTETFEEWHVELLELIEIDSNRVLAVVRDGGRIRGSEREIYNDFAHLWTLREGRLVRWAGFTDKARALEATAEAE